MSAAELSLTVAPWHNHHGYDDDDIDVCDDFDFGDDKGRVQ